MKNLYEALRQRELDIQRLRREIAILKSIIPLFPADTKGEHARFQGIGAKAVKGRPPESTLKGPNDRIVFSHEQSSLLPSVPVARPAVAPPAVAAEANQTIKPDAIITDLFESVPGSAARLSSTKRAPAQTKPPSKSSVSRGQGAAAAAAPAKELPVPGVAGSETSSAAEANSASVPSFSGLDDHGEEATSSTKNGFVIGIVTILVIVMAAYCSRRHQKPSVETPASNATQVQAK